jgi:hypothetical protein
LAQLKELLVLVGRVEQDGVAGLLAAQDEHVVVHGADNQFVDLGLVVLEMESWLRWRLDRPV